jgi:hypothetical protein
MRRIGPLFRLLGKETSMTSLRSLVAVTLPLLSLGSACATARMVIPADVDDASEVLTVSDRSRASGAFINESFKLGNYEVVDVDRKWTTGDKSGIGPWSKETKITGFSYALAKGGRKLPGKCSSTSSSTSVGGFSWGGTEIACVCEGRVGKSEILMTDESQTMKVGGKDYKLVPINAIEGGKTQSKPAGFRADADETLGAVEVVHPGQIWLKKGLDDATRDQAACVFVGLMLYQEPSAI